MLLWREPWMSSRYQLAQNRRRERPILRLRLYDDVLSPGLRQLEIVARGCV